MTPQGGNKKNTRGGGELEEVGRLFQSRGRFGARIYLNSETL